MPEPMPTDREGAPLTPMQREVLICRCAHGLSWIETAQRLRISKTTVNYHLTRAFRKLGARTSEAACFRFGLRAAHLVAVKRGERDAA